MELLVLLGLAVIVAGIRHEIRAARARRRRARALASRAATARHQGPVVVVATLIALALCGCNKVGATKPDLPPSTLVKPTVVYVDRYVYVPIRSDLLKTEPVAEGPLAQCPIVAADRKAALLRVNSRLTQIGAIQGTEAKP